MTRWDADPGRGGEEGERETNELKSPWWAITATEIYPIGVAGGIDRTMLARATARLCHQTIAWSDRSRYPVPLHAAKQLDLDHPQYRRSAPPEEQGEEAPEEQPLSLPLREIAHHTHVQTDRRMGPGYRRLDQRGEGWHLERLPTLPSCQSTR
ncbi:RNaseH domain-containing protein [Streptomyces albidoflavus]